MWILLYVAVRTDLMSLNGVKTAMCPVANSVPTLLDDRHLSTCRMIAGLTPPRTMGAARSRSGFPLRRAWLRMQANAVDAPTSGTRESVGAFPPNLSSAALAEKGVARALREDAHLANGLNVSHGALCNAEVGAALDLPVQSLEEALATLGSAS